MGVPDPPNRRQKRAARYIEELTAQIRANSISARHDEQITLYVWALIIVALFGDEERALFAHTYRSEIEGQTECLAEVREHCSCEGKEQLCQILDNVLATLSTDHRVADFMMEIIQQQSWSAIQTELKARKLRAEDFVWWTFDPHR
jgi:hypothetical protein